MDFSVQTSSFSTRVDLVVFACTLIHVGYGGDRGSSTAWELCFVSACLQYGTIC